MCAQFGCMGGSSGISRCTRLWPIAYVGRVSVYARFAVTTFLVRSLLVLWLLRWTIRGLCCDLVSGALAQEVLMRGECCTSAGPLVSSVLSLTVNNLR